MLKLISWNVNGIRAAQTKGFTDWLAASGADIVGLQETKATPDQLDESLLRPPGYQSHWTSSERKGYSGCAIYSRLTPRQVQDGLGLHKYDSEGRTLIAEYDDFVFITAYFPNGGNDHERVPFKLEYYDDFLKYVNGLRADGRSVIFCGDLNTAHQAIDLARPKENVKTTGFMPEERVWLDRYVAEGWVDIFRERYPELEGAYTWWSMRSGARGRNVGWRIDYFFVSPDLCERVVDAAIHPEVMGSDHCPISLTLR